MVLLAVTVSEVRNLDALIPRNVCLLQAIYISRITEGGAAAKDGKLRVGDRVISVSTDAFVGKS